MSLRPPRQMPDFERRMVVLQCLRFLGPCTDLQLLRFLTEYDLMNYFDMMFALTDLCAQGQAVRTKEQVGYIYNLTEAGKEAMALFGDRVPRSVQAIVTDNAPRWARRFAQEGQCAASIDKNAWGEWDLTLSLRDNQNNMMRLILSLPSQQLAGEISRKWPDKAAEIYRQIIRILAGEGA